MIAKLASRAAKPRASRAGLEPGPGVFLVEPEDGAGVPARPRRRGAVGGGPGDGASACTTSGCARWATWPALPLDTLVRRLGKASGAHLAALARGEDPIRSTRTGRTSRSGTRRPSARTSSTRTSSSATCCAWPSRWPRMLRGATSSARTITVKVKFKDLSHADPRRTRSERPIATGGAIGQVAAALLAGVDPGEGIRLLGVSASGLTGRGRPALLRPRATGSPRTIRAPRPASSPGRRSTAAVDAIRDRFGKSAVGSAAMVTEEGVQVPARRDAPWGPDE